jgi:hypothetical protein
VQWRKVTVITGVHSVGVDDVRAQLREVEADVNLDVARVPISRVEDVVRGCGRRLTPSSWC